MLRRAAFSLLFLISIVARAQVTVPLITGMTPERGPIGTEVTIDGANFGTDPTSAIVYFGAVKAVVMQLTPTQIKTRVPIGTSYKPVSVTVNKRVGFSPKPFIVTWVNETLVNSLSFSNMIPLDVGGAPYEVAATDLDVDGKPDLIVAGYSTISVWRNTSTRGSLISSSFASKVDVVTNALSAVSIATGDIDGDGKTDIVAVSGLGNVNSVTVIKNNCVPGFITAASFESYVFAVGPNPQKVAIADLDNDGKPDLITANGNNSISILHARTGETGISFENHIDINVATPGTAETIAAADMDLDGKTDLIEYNFSNNQYRISLLRNQAEQGIIGQGSFALPVSFGAGVISDSDIAIGDLDNDGRPDLLANFGSSNTISVLKNLSLPGNFNAASLATKVDFGTGTNPLCGKAIADINGDGLPDLISTNRESNTWSALQNKVQTGVINTASFLPKVDFITGQKPTGIAAADFDGDGMTDVAVVSRESRTASIYRNQMADPQIFSYSPQYGGPGTVVTINGINFGNIPSELTVKINGINANLETITPMVVTLIVPPGATTGPLTVTRNGTTNVTNAEFTVMPLTISEFSPTTAFAGEQLIIKGTGFSSKSGNNVVLIGAVQASVESSTPNEIRVTVPPGAITGRITVITNQAIIAISAANLVITPVAITATAFPELFNVEEEAVTATLSYSNVELVSAINFMSRGITSQGDFHADDIEVSPSGEVAFTMPPSYFDDPIGLQMRFVVTDIDGNKIFREGYAYKKFPQGNVTQNIPGLTFGREIENYHIIAIPLELTSRSVLNVFRQFGGFDASTWRVFAFDQTTRELKTPGAAINPGSGYWFIARTGSDINPGEGTTVHANPSHPYVMKLKPGWNLIGNPYNFTLSWDGVLSYNGNPLSVGTLRQFDAGKFLVGNTLDRFHGGFVRNDSTADVFLKIPVTNNFGAGRKRSEEEDPRNWEVILTVSDGKLSNALGGFGMNVNASENTDRLDEVELPLPAAMSSFELIMRDAMEDIVKDIVPTRASYTWSGTVSSFNGVTLSWDNITLQQLAQELWMELPGHPALVDMRLANHIDFPSGLQSFRIVYGNRDYVLRETEAHEVIVGDVSPNPLPKTSGVLSIPVNLPSETSAVQLDVIDMRGAKIRRSLNGMFTRGRNVIQWSDDLFQLSPGLYVLSITIAAGNSTETFYRKFILE